MADILPAAACPSATGPRRARLHQLLDRRVAEPFRCPAARRRAEDQADDTVTGDGRDVERGSSALGLKLTSTSMMTPMTATAGTSRAPSLFTRDSLPFATGAVALVTLGAFENRAVMTVLPTVAEQLGGLWLFGAASAGSLISFVVATAVAGAWADRRGPLQPLYAGLGSSCSPRPRWAWLRRCPCSSQRVGGGLAEGLIDLSLVVLLARALPEELRAKVFAAFAAAWVLPSLLGLGRGRARRAMGVAQRLPRGDRAHGPGGRPAAAGHAPGARRPARTDLVGRRRAPHRGLGRSRRARPRRSDGRRVAADPGRPAGGGGRAPRRGCSSWSRPRERSSRPGR